jgi:hypothetical protein
MNKNTIIVAAIILVIVAAAGGFFAGLTYQKNQTSVLGMAGQNGSRQGGNFAARAGQNAAFRPVRGQVLSTSDTSLTVKMSDGSTKIVVLSSSTAFMQSTKAALADVKVGNTVNVVGTANSDGSVTATDIQINPPTQGGFARPVPANQPATAPATGTGY